MCRFFKNRLFCFFFALEIHFCPEKPITYGGSLPGFLGSKVDFGHFSKIGVFFCLLRGFFIGVLCGKQKVLTLIMSTFCIRFVQIIGVKPFGVLVVAYAQGQKRNPHIYLLDIPGGGSAHPHSSNKSASGLP